MGSSGICLLSVVSVRNQPAHKGEQVSQLLFGEVYSVLDVCGGWLKIRIQSDGYEGFIPFNQHFELQDSDLDDLLKLKTHTAYRLISRLEDLRTGVVFPVLRGSTLYASDGEMFQIGGRQFLLHEDILPNRPEDSVQRLLDFAFTYLNAPYQWGGRSPFGVDCSGFMQVVFKSEGISLPRDAWQQATLGQEVAFIQEVRPGDLAFFSSAEEEDGISHVGLIYDNEAAVIHASGWVKVGLLDNAGLFDPLTKRHTHFLRFIKRILVT